MKYNHTEEEETVHCIDPVNEHILAKNYTNKIKMSRLDRMKLIAERKKNITRIETFLKEKEESKLKEKKAIERETIDKMMEEENQTSQTQILKENVIKLDEEKINPPLEEMEEDESWETPNDYHLNAEEEDEEDDDDDDEEEFDFDMDDELDEDDYEEEETFTYDKDQEMDTRMLYFFVDCDEEELKELSEEDRKIVEAYRNSQKNSLLLKPKKKKALPNTHPQESKNDTYDDLKAKTTPQKTELNSLNNNSQQKRKNSVNSNASNSNRKKKIVTFRMGSNQFNGR